MSGELIVMALAGLLALLLVLIIGRWVVMWWLGMAEVVGLLKEIRDDLRAGRAE